MESKREFMRHALATLEYRLRRAVEDAPREFADFDGAGKTPLQILAHMGDLFDWAISIVEGREIWQASRLLSWDDELRRFASRLEQFDGLIQSSSLESGAMDRLFQGPVADALTHVGQIAMLRRMANCKIKGENYYRAPIGVKVDAKP